MQLVSLQVLPEIVLRPFNPKYLRNNGTVVAALQYRMPTVVNVLLSRAVETRVSGCTSRSNTMATPLMPPLKALAKALSMGLSASSAPIFHWLLAWRVWRMKAMKATLPYIHFWETANLNCQPYSMEKLSAFAAWRMKTIETLSLV